MSVKYSILAFLVLILAPACKKKGCTDPLAENYNSEAGKDDGSCQYADPLTYNSTISFSHEINGSSFLFDTILYVHPAGQLFSVQTLRYFISDIVMHKVSGDSIYFDMAHYVDAKDYASRQYHYQQSIDNGDYSGISFIFGLDTIKNSNGAFVNPPESLMEWPVPMGGGYHYMKMEGKYDSSGVIKNYNTHTGMSMGVPYHFRVNLVQPFTITKNEVDIEIIMELNNWYQNPTLYDFDVFGEAIMGNASAQQTLKENGHNVFSLGLIQ